MIAMAQPIFFAGMLLFGALSFPVSGRVLWQDKGPYVICQVTNGLDVLHGAVKPRNSNSSDALYFKFVVNPLSDTGTKLTDNYYEAGLVLYDHNQKGLGIGSEWITFGYSAFDTADIDPKNGVRGRTDLNSLNGEALAPRHRFEAPRSRVRRTIVFRVQYIPGSPDIVTVWLEPDLSPGATEAAQNTNLITMFRANAFFDELRLCHHGGGNGWEFSDLAVATTFEDFVRPYYWEEPQHFGMGIALLLVLSGTSVWWWHHVITRRQILRLERSQALANERARIAQDLHDDLGGTITRILWLSELARLDRNAAEKVEEHASKIAAQARHMSCGLEEIVWAVNPQNDTLQSLIQYIASHINETFASTQIHCRLEAPAVVPGITMESSVRHDVFLALKESLNNVIKHSGAVLATVRIEFAGNRLVIQVADNGTGFEPETADARRNGLKNIKKRIERVGGVYSCISTKGAGVQLTFAIKLPDPAEPASA